MIDDHINFIVSKIKYVYVVYTTATQEHKFVPDFDSMSCKGNSLLAFREVIMNKYQDNVRK